MLTDNATRKRETNGERAGTGYNRAVEESGRGKGA
jgi:hypothetical protein